MIDQPIGLFDSGVGGLTVLAALVKRLPSESYLYLGDTARLPYGTKSAHTVTRYALQAADILETRGIKALVVACNTASAIALEALEKEYSHRIPVIGVVRPGAEAAVAASKTGRIAVISTESTARQGAYVREIHRLRPRAEVVSKPCALFVALAEEGWTHGPIVEAVAREYLGPLFAGATSPDTLVLGCTHFPPLAPTLQGVVGSAVAIVDSAATTAHVVEASLREKGLLREVREPGDRLPPRVTMLATDAPDRFARVSRHFLPESLVPSEVELVDL